MTISPQYLFLYDFDHVDDVCVERTPFFQMLYVSVRPLTFDNGIHFDSMVCIDIWSHHQFFENIHE